MNKATPDADEWISAAEAVAMPGSGRRTICTRAHAGLIKARAERFIRDGRAADGVDVPAEFWWAKGSGALTQNWMSGDFETWIKQTVHLQAFGVTFRRSDIERLKAAPVIVEAPFQAGYAFIAMPIDPEDHQLVDVLDAIKEAASQCGVQAERVDEVESNDRITDRILESISKAEFVIVDLTNERPNVFFEAGFAHGLKKTPIYIARQGTKVHFDIKDYPIIFFRSIKELKEGLKKRLAALKSKREHP